MENSKIAHRFFRIRASALNDNNEVVNGVGHVCFAIVPCRTGTGKFRVAASFKSPADTVDRSLGILIADGRLTCRKSGRNFLVKAATLEAAVKTAASTLLERKRSLRRRGRRVLRPFVPNWLLDALVDKERKLVALSR